MFHALSGVFKMLKASTIDSIPGWCCLFLLETKKQKIWTNILHHWLLPGCWYGHKWCRYTSESCFRISQKVQQAVLSPPYDCDETWTGRWAWYKPDLPGAKLAVSSFVQTVLRIILGQALGTGNGHDRLLKSQKKHWKFYKILANFNRIHRPMDESNSMGRHLLCHIVGCTGNRTSSRVRLKQDEAKDVCLCIGV